MEMLHVDAKTWRAMAEKERRRTRPPHLNATDGPAQPWTAEAVIEHYGGLLGCQDALFKGDNYHQIVIETALLLCTKGMIDWQYQSGGGNSAVWVAPNGNGNLRVWTDGKMT